MHLVPWDQDLMSLEYDGLFISNGPGDPSLAKMLIGNVRKVGCEAFTVFELQRFSTMFMQKMRFDHKKW